MAIYSQLSLLRCAVRLLYVPRNLVVGDVVSKRLKILCGARLNSHLNSACTEPIFQHP